MGLCTGVGHAPDWPFNGDKGVYNPVHQGGLGSDTLLTHVFPLFWDYCCCWSSCSHLHCFYFSGDADTGTLHLLLSGLKCYGQSDSQRWRLSWSIPNCLVSASAVMGTLNVMGVHVVDQKQSTSSRCVRTDSKLRIQLSRLPCTP